MKRLGLFLLCVSWAALACWVGCLEMRVQRLEAVRPEPVLPEIHKKLRCDKLIAKHIEVSAPGCKYQIDMRAGPDRAGLWLAGGNKQIAIYNDAQQTYLGVYHLGKFAGGCPIAVSVTDDGKPFIQMVEDGKYHSFGPKELTK